MFAQYIFQFYKFEVQTNLMQENNDYHSQTTIQSVNHANSHSQQDNPDNRQIFSNYSTQANLSSENDLKFQEMINYGQPISDFNQIEEEKHEIENFEEGLKVNEEGQRENQEKDNKGINQFEFQQREIIQIKNEEQLNPNTQFDNKNEQKVYEKMDIAEMDQAGKQIPQNINPIINEQRINLPQNNNTQPQTIQNENSKQNRYMIFQLQYKTNSKDNSLLNTPNNQEQNHTNDQLQSKQNQQEPIQIIITSPSKQHQYQNINASIEVKKVHFQADDDHDKRQNKDEISQKDIKRQKNEQGQSENGNRINQDEDGQNLTKQEKQKPMQLQYINGQLIKQTNKSQHSQHKKSSYNNSNHAQYATSADRNSLSSQKHENEAGERAIIRNKIYTNHVSIQVDLSRSGKPTKKYKGSQNILKGKTTYKKVEIKEEQDSQNRDYNQINQSKEIKRKTQQQLQGKQTTKKNKTKIQTQNTKSPRRFLEKQIDPNAMKDNLGSKYTWVLRNHDKQRKKKISAKKTLNNNKSKQIYQKRTSLRLNQQLQQDESSLNNNSIQNSNMHSPSSYSNQNHSNNENTSSLFNIGKQSLRTRKNKKNTQNHQNQIKKDKKSRNKSLKNDINKKSINKKSVSKYSTRKNESQEQIDINYIKTHIKQIDIRNLRLERAFNPLTHQDQVITQFISSQYERIQQNDVDNEDQIKRQIQINEEIKIEQDRQEEEEEYIYELIPQMDGKKQQDDDHQQSQINQMHQNSPIQQNIQYQSIINQPETASARRRISQERQLTIQESFSRVQPKKPKLQKYRIKQQTVKIKRVIDPNINNHGIYALFELSQRSRFLTKCRYALVPITNLSKAKKRHIDEDCKKARELVEQQQKDNLAYVAITMPMLELMQQEVKRRSQ